MFLYHTAALNAWDRIQELGKIIESYIKVKQGPRKHFSDILQSVQIGVTDPEARCILIESLALKMPT